VHGVADSVCANRRETRLRSVSEALRGILGAMERAVRPLPRPLPTPARTVAGVAAPAEPDHPAATLALALKALRPTGTALPVTGAAVA
jgi:hypothetical protein